VRLLKRSVRERDPFYVVKDGWVIRRLGPHCGRIELAQFPKHRDEKAILKAIGREMASSRVAEPALGRKPDWLHEAMAKATEQDWQAYRSAGDGA
jgi:hypothetical protein